jgi:hypothetical protein
MSLTTRWNIHIVIFFVNCKKSFAAEHLVDSEFRPIYRLLLWSGVLESFALKTEFTRG